MVLLVLPDGARRQRGVPRTKNNLRYWRNLKRTKRYKEHTAAMKEWARVEAEANEEFHQGDEEGSRVNFFEPAVAQEKMNPTFRTVLERRSFTPAREILDAMTYYFEDPDGNVVEQFQSTGFNARFWELYLCAAFTELGYALDRQYAAPDFDCVGLLGDFFVEATTVNPSDTAPEVNEDNRM